MGMKALFSLNTYFYRYRGRLIAGIVFVTISNIFGILPAKLIRFALDDTANQISWYRLTRDFEAGEGLLSSISFNLMVFVAIVLLLALLKGLFMFFMRQTIIVISRYIEYDLKNDIYAHYQKLDYNFYSRNNTGDLMNRISEDVSRVRMYVGPAIMYTVNLVVMFALVIVAMASVNAELTLYTLLPLPVLSAVIYYVHDIINKKSEQVQFRLSGLSTYVQEAFSGIRVLKSYSREEHNHKGFSRMADDYKNLSMDLVRVNALFHPVLLILVGLSTIITVYLGGMKVMEGAITIGNVAEFIIYVNMLTWPVASLGWVVSLVQRAEASQQRINEFLHSVPTIQPGSGSPFPVRGSISFQNVSYTYPNSAVKALDQVSFQIDPGQSLGIVGRTGSGKSTIAALVMRLVDPDEGKVLIDGHDLKTMDLGSYRSQTGYVAQEVFLFSDTIANNIAFGLSDSFPPGELEKRITEAAANAVILDSIREFPHQFETRVGERGITLSGGQKQRVSIARAIIRNPSILVFDDCLSAVDTRTEERILANLKRIMEGKTTLLISHRISTVLHSDRILVLDQGRVAEHGSHKELLEKNGVYAQMFEKQSLENQIE